MNPASVKGVEADALVSSGDSWYLFRFGSLQYLRLPLKAEDWSGKLSASEKSWLEIASPGGAFRPVQAVVGNQGHFYLVDAATGRLCLYDTAAQILSTFPLPQAVLPATPGRIATFRANDGAFTFMDYMAGEAVQFADRQGSEGGTDWVLRNKVKLPLGIRDCIQDPKTFGMGCNHSDLPMRFDASLNAVKPSPSQNGNLRLSWDANAEEWVLEFYSSDLARPLFRFWTTQHRLESIPPASP